MTAAQPTTSAPATPATGDAAAERTFSLSVLISGIRCTLTYVVFPWIFPIIGIAGGVGPVVGISMGLVAIAANVVSIRRLWASCHRLRVPISALNVGIIGLLLVLLAVDLGNL